MTSHGILHYLCSADLSKSFSLLIVSIFVFSRYFFNRFCSLKKVFCNWLCQYWSFFNIFLIHFARWKRLGLPHIAYIMILDFNKTDKGQKEITLLPMPLKWPPRCYDIIHKCHFVKLMSQIFAKRSEQAFVKMKLILSRSHLWACSVGALNVALVMEG